MRISNFSFEVPAINVGGVLRTLNAHAGVHTTDMNLNSNTANFTIEWDSKLPGTKFFDLISDLKNL